MTTVTTVTADAAHRPDVVGIAVNEIMPSAVFLAAGYKAGTVEGDAPAVRIPVIPDVTAVETAEGAVIDEQTPTLDEAVVTTTKLASLATVSNEQASNADSLAQVVEAMSRGIVRQADEAFLNGDDGILADLDVTAYEAGLDEIADAVATIEDAFGTPHVIVAAPGAWAAISKEIGLAHDAVERRVLGVPVVTNAAMPSGGLLVVGVGSVAYVSGDLRVATSADSAFSADAVQVRATLRLGRCVVHPSRVVLLNTGAEPEDGQEG